MIATEQQKDTVGGLRKNACRKMSIEMDVTVH